MSKRKIFVLVHGAWHGGWCWRRVADRLEQQGHVVYAPTLTGVADRSHLLTAEIGLATHITDIVNLMKWADLTDVVLVGHSYGGFVVSGVAEQMEQSIASIIFLDAFVPEDGQCLVDLTAPENGERTRSAAKAGAIAVPPVPAAYFKVNKVDAAYVDKMCTPQPIRCFLDPLPLTGARERIARKAYILATVYAGGSFVATHDRLKSDPTWKTYGVPCGHDVMLDMPDRLTELLLEAA